MLTATKIWHCHCGCEEEIKPGTRFTITEGTFLKEGHTMTAKDFLREHVFVCTIPGTEDQRKPWEIEVARRERERKEKRMENPLAGTMFDAEEMEARATEQVNLFAEAANV